MMVTNVRLAKVSFAKTNKRLNLLIPDYCNNFPLGDIKVKSRALLLHGLSNFFCIIRLNVRSTVTGWLDM